MAPPRLRAVKGALIGKLINGLITNEKMAELRKGILDPAPQEDGPEKDAARAKYRQATADQAGQWRHDTPPNA